MDIWELLRMLAALGLVLGLIAALVWLARRGGVNFGARKNTSARLSIVESHSIDMKRKLLLIRRDNVEHLILIGPAGEVVIESNITPPNTPHKGTP